MDICSYLFRKLLRLIHFRDLLGNSCDGIINHRIYYMDGTAVYVQNNMITIINILMNQN